MEIIKEKWRQLLWEEDDLLPLDRLTLDTVYILKRSCMIMARFVSDVFLDEGQIKSMRKAVQKCLGDVGMPVKVELAYPSLFEGMKDEKKGFMSIIEKAIKDAMPGCAPYLKGAEFDMQEGTLLITVKESMGQEMLVEKGADRLLEKTMRELFLKELRVTFASREKVVDLDAFLEESRRLDEELEKQYVRVAPKKKDGPITLMGSSLQSAKTMPIAELTEMTGRACVEGVIFSKPEKKELSSGKTIVGFQMTDYAGSILCKAFLDEGKGDRLDALAVGSRVKVRGNVSMDSFARDLCLGFFDISLLPEIKREDDAPEKRVELHLHTQMSQMDAVTSAADLIKRAAQWGHEAIAITDHGVVQAFPEAFDTVKALKKQGKSIKLIPGVEGYLVDDSGVIVSAGGDVELDACRFVVLDIETTGLKAGRDRIIEIAAVKVENGKVVAEFESFVDPKMRIPADSIKIHGIRDDMVQGAPEIDAVMRDLAQFCQGYILSAHNASFDMGFLRIAARDAGVVLTEQVVDTLALSRAVHPEFKSHKLNVLCKKLGIKLENHHRALFDTRATAMLLVSLLDTAKENFHAKTLNDLNALLGKKVATTKASYHIIVLAKNQQGLKNLYELVSDGHLRHFNSRPHMLKSELSRLREGLIIGSACEAGELIQGILQGKDDEQLKQTASFYDFLEIQPTGNNEFMLRNGLLDSERDLQKLNLRVLRLGDALGKPVCATCDVHFMNPEDAIYRAVLMAGMGFSDADQQAPLYFRTTNEMLDEFAYLGERAKEVVVDNPRRVASWVEEIKMFPKHPRDEETFQPTLENAENIIKDMAQGNAKKLYGQDLPEIVRARLDKELGSIIGNGFATLYLSAHRLIKKSNEDGYLVGSRGSVGSSFVATVCDITEVNPLPPHYLCPKCQFSDFEVDVASYACGIDLPERDCPVCGAPLNHTGYDIPFEVFLGFNGDKVPDIDLNFSGVYQPVAHEYVKTLFGEGNVFKAGTIGTLAEKTAYGFVKKYLGERDKVVTKAEENRLVKGCTGVKRTTGQHPGGMVIVPNEYSVYQFSPIQHPADDKESDIVTTHFDFNSLHDILVKLDILGHDDPTMINMLERLTGKNAMDIPLNHPEVMRLFTSPEPLGTEPEAIMGCTTGTLGIPEFGTKFVRQMLEDTQPSSMGELVRISGLSHGTNVWLNNAQDMIKDGLATLKTCFCTRDDIMNYLIQMGAEDLFAFSTMEAVRKGRKLTPAMESTMRELNVPQHYIDSCNKIEYMFPRAHAAAYVAMAYRVAWYKIYEPLAYYASYFTVRADEFDASIMLDDPPSLQQRMRQIDRTPREQRSPKDETTYLLLEIANEMRQRGFDFLPVDLYKSSHNEFIIEDGKIRPPFNRLPGVGNAAAESLAKAREDGPFISIDELQKRAKVSSAVIETLRGCGALRDLPQSSQVNLFEI